MPPIYVCELCEKRFQKRFNLNRHISSVHPGNNITTPYKTVNLKCGICGDSFSNKNAFAAHVSERHDIIIVTEKLEFPNQDQFYDWKYSIEDRYNSGYVKNSSGYTLADKSISVTFQCHRSGYFNSKVCPEERKREIKKAGSSKINAYCPSKIKAVFCVDGQVNVEFCITHIGHRIELAHLNLNARERKDIATTKISVKRLLTKDDLDNIEMEFSLNSDTISNDAVSVHAWVEKEKLSENNCILLYKPQGTLLAEFPQFKKDDFALGIMTDAQTQMLENYGSDCICVDRTHSMEACNFQMVTLLVLDDLRQGFPCAFFISNKTDKKCLETFFTAVKQRVGIIRSKVFMSDMAEFFYTAWLSTMGASDMHLFCSWHVDRAWRKNLTKIKETEKQKGAYKLLRALLQETDECAFLQTMETVIQQLQNDDMTKEFGIYFEKYFVHSCKSWAYCFRKDAGINTNMHLQRMHRTLKYLFLKGKTVNRLAVHAIMQFIRSKMFDRLLMLEKGKFTTKLMSNLRKRHSVSSLMNTDLISASDNCSWIIASSKSDELYTVRLAEPDCKCSILCKHCDACIHNYTCTCIDACMKWNMCKHIHLLCRAFRETLSALNTANDEYMNNADYSHELHIKEEEFEENVLLLQELGDDRTKDASFQQLKKQVIEEFFSVINNTHEIRELKLVQDCVKSVVPLINAARRNTEIKTLNQVEKCSARKGISSQMRFITKTKKRAVKLLTKPTSQKCRKLY